MAKDIKKETTKHPEEKKTEVKSETNRSCGCGCECIPPPVKSK
jgi:hypothetical protein